MKKLVVFDFDGTLTRRDSFLVFLQNCFPVSKIITNDFLLLPVLILHKLKLMNPDSAKQKVLNYFLEGVDENLFQKECNWFADEIIPKLLTAQAKKFLAEYQSRGFEIVILSASPEIYLKPWCEKNSFRCIATKLKTVNGKFTGEYDGKNCRAEEKLRRLKDEIDLNSYSEIHAFGDSPDDKPFMSIAHKQVYRAL